MKNKEEIKKEIIALANKIAVSNNDEQTLELSRELHEKAVLLKHVEAQQASVDVIKEAPPEKAIPEVVKKIEQPVEEEKKQPSIDLFSAEPEVAEVVEPKAPEPTPPAPPIEEAKEKAPAEKKETKKETVMSIAEKQQHKKIADLKTFIGINEKFQFINELFEGNMKEYNVAIDQINSFATLEEAESYIANLEDVYKWNSENEIAENFKELTQRHFS